MSMTNPNPKPSFFLFLHEKNAIIASPQLEVNIQQMTRNFEDVAVSMILYAVNCQ